MTRSPTLLRHLLPAMLAAPFAACHGAPRPTLGEADYPGTLQRPETLDVQAVWQQRVTAAWQVPGEEARERGFDTAVQRRGDRLTVIGLSPMGSIGFSIEQGPDGVTVANNIPEQLVIPPRFILLDVQRTFYPWFDAPLHDGERVTERDDERILERWRDGRLVERRFERLDGARDGVIRISYQWDRDGWAVPTRAVLDNGWFGYRLTIETHGETRIPPEGRP
ncbi:MAG: DUF3261 domain-containing protein [Planctomycetes bacterium]|nr:DUF3261 domain-containing protein [Planctomycetota bacterium]